MAYRFIGVTTKRVYSFLVNPLIPGFTTITIGGEVAVPANNDLELARGYRGPAPPSDPFGFTIIPSTWEQQ